MLERINGAQVIVSTEKCPHAFGQIASGTEFLATANWAYQSQATKAVYFFITQEFTHREGSSIKWIPESENTDESLFADCGAGRFSVHNGRLGPVQGSL